MSSKRYVVFSNERGTETEIVEFEWPNTKEDQHPGGLSPIGIVYDHQNDDKTDFGIGNNIVGKPLSGNPQISDLVGKVLTIADAMFVDRDQREAFKSLLRQTIYGYANDGEKQVSQAYATHKRISNKVR